MGFIREFRCRQIFVDLLCDFQSFGKVEEPDVFEKLYFRVLSISHPEGGFVGLNPVIVEILADFVLLFFVDESIGTHVDEFLEVIFGEDVGKGPFDVDFVLVDVWTFIKGNLGTLVFFWTGLDSDKGLEDEEGNLWLESVVDFGGVVFEEGVN